ncbi:hypothetical protein KP05_16320 [Cobetia amphilecti]|uniref:hypothetical protein n=1 Tax=Cobetia amphilecti TaxID=1055104 RepID=UPI0004FF90C6|nr:hypothetical protein [Cobetia amphilecti]KGA00924.1 hypothetical protein KP05_16320 [Cobetia amphilecti]
MQQPPHQTPETPDVEGFIELSESTIDAIKAAGRKLEEDVQAGRLPAGSSRWMMAPSGERFCIRHSGPALDEETDEDSDDECEPDADPHRQSLMIRCWQRLLARVKR